LLSTTRHTLGSVSGTLASVLRQFEADELALRRALEVARSRLSLQDALQNDLRFTQQELQKRDAELLKVRQAVSDCDALVEQLRQAHQQVQERDTVLVQLRLHTDAQIQASDKARLKAVQYAKACKRAYDEQKIVLSPASQEAQELLASARNRATVAENLLQAAQTQLAATAGEADRLGVALTFLQSQNQQQATELAQARTDVSKARAEAALALAQRDQAQASAREANVKRAELYRKLDATQAALATSSQAFGSLVVELQGLRRQNQAQDESLKQELSKFATTCATQERSVAGLRVTVEALRMLMVNQPREAKGAAELKDVIEQSQRVQQEQQRWFQFFRELPGRIEQILNVVTPLPARLASLDTRLYEEAQQRDRLSRSAEEQRKALSVAQERITLLAVQVEREQGDKQRALKAETVVRKQLASTEKQVKKLQALKAPDPVLPPAATVQPPLAALPAATAPSALAALPAARTSLLLQAQQSGSLGGSALVKWASAALSQTELLPPPANSLDGLADAVITSMGVVSRRRDSHLLGRTLMHCAMEELLRAPLPIDMDRTSQAVVLRFKVLLSDYKDVLPVDFQQWVKETGPFIGQVSTIAVHRLAAQLTTAAPLSFILQRPEVLAIVQESQELKRRLDARASDEQTAKKLVFLHTQMDALLAEQQKLSSELREARKEMKVQEPARLPSDPMVPFPDLLLLMKQKIDLSHQIARYEAIYQENSGKQVTAEVLKDASPTGMLKAARAEEERARWHFYRLPVAATGRTVSWQKEGELLDVDSERALCEKTERENEKLKKLYQQLHKRHQEYFGDE
jgi:hypothetical protein